MNLQFDPTEAGALASLLTGTGGSEAAQQQAVAATPAPVQQSPGGPISANTQNPIPNQAGFYDLLAGTAAPSPAQQQVESAPRMSRGDVKNAAPQAPSAAPQQAANPVMQLLQDPNALLLMAATMAQANPAESTLQAAGRGLMTGVQYLNAKSRQKILDQQTAAQAGRQQLELDIREAESGARIEESKVRTAGARQQQAETEATKDQRRRETQLKLDALEVKLGQAKTESERSRIQNQMDNIKLGYEQKYGEQLAAGKVSEQTARTRSLEAQAAENEAQAGVAKGKAEALASLPPEDRRRVMLGGAAKSLKTREDRLNEFINKNLGQYQDPRTGSINITSAIADFDAVDQAGNAAPGTTKQTTPQSIRQEALDAIKRGAPKDKVNARLKQMGYAPVD